MGARVFTLAKCLYFGKVPSMPHPTPLRIALDAAGFYVALGAVLSLLLAGCGSEPEAQPAPPEVVAAHEVCTVTLLPDGQVQCTCEVAQ